MRFLTKFMPSKSQTGDERKGTSDRDDEKFEGCVVPFDEPASTPRPPRAIAADGHLYIASPVRRDTDSKRALKEKQLQEDDKDLVSYPTSLYGGNKSRRSKHITSNGRAEGDNDPPSDEDSSLPSRASGDFTFSTAHQVNENDDSSTSTFFSTDQSVEAVLVPQADYPLPSTLSFSSQEERNISLLNPISMQTSLSLSSRVMGSEEKISHPTPMSVLGRALANGAASTEGESGPYSDHSTIPVSNLASVHLECQSLSSLEDLEDGTTTKKSDSLPTISKRRSLSLLGYEDSDDDEDVTHPVKKDPKHDDTKGLSSTNKSAAASKASSIFDKLSANSTQESDTDSGVGKSDPLSNYNKRQRRKKIRRGIIGLMVLVGLAALACAIVFGLERMKGREPYRPEQDPLLAAVGVVVSSAPSQSPSSTKEPAGPTMDRASTSPTQPTTFEGPSVANFYVIGDLPYNENEKERLIQHVANLPDDAEFLVHVGDIRDAEDGSNCTLSEFEIVGDILKQSPVPVFIVPGDNEYNDCPNLQESWGHWLAVFGNLESHWNSSLQVSRDPVRPENFYFVHQRMLYIGLNIVGGIRLDIDEWETRLSHQWTWTKELIETHILEESGDAEGIVIFAHADPRPLVHGSFFDPLQSFIAMELNNTIPTIYINGDQHYFQFDDDFYGQPNFHRIMVEGGSSQPPLRMTVTVPTNRTAQEMLPVQDIYEYNRFLQVD